MAGFAQDRLTAEARKEELDQWADDRWYPILFRLDRELSALDPDYNLIQVKEKFGGLRYYIGIKEDVREQADDLIYMAEYNCYALDKEARRG